jgi:hypothetical protein
MDPDGIDDSIVLPEEIEFLKETEDRSLVSHGLPFMVMRKAYKVRSIYEAANSRVEDQPCLIRSFSLEQIDQIDQ